jgi:phosphoribosylaminoimidazole-succinocarboxamide synthase
MLLYEGKAKRVFRTETDGVYRIEYKDMISLKGRAASTI